MSKIILSVENISKHYGPIKAVNKLSLEIKKGEIFGILGPNGSGKTTLLGMVLDVINLRNGSFSWFGGSKNHEARKKIGAILETPNFYPYLSAIKNLEIIADIKGVSYHEIPKVLKMVDLTHRQNSKFRTFSLGMKQRLAIAAALLGDPEVLILDEPTNGLDPQGIAEIRNLIKEIGKRGVTIILASHLLDEVQKVCSHVTVLNKGKNIFSGKVDEVLNENIMVEVSAPDNALLRKHLNDFNKLISAEPEDGIILVKLQEGTNIAELSTFLMEKKIALTHLAQRKKSLENYFLELLAESHD